MNGKKKLVRELRRLAAELNTIKKAEGESIIPDLSTLDWIEDSGKNADFWTYLKIGGKWYEIQHDEGFVGSAHTINESEIRERYERLEKEGKLILPGSDQKLRGGIRAVSTSEGSSESAKDFKLQMGEPDTAKEVSGAEIAQWVDQGTFDEEMANSYPEGW